MRLILILLAGMLPLSTQAALPSSAGHKLDKRLAVIAAAAQEQRAQPLMAAALNREIFRLNTPLETRWNAAGQVQVYLHYARDGVPPLTNTLAALGAENILVSQPLAVVQAWVPADRLYDMASLPEVTRITVPRYAVVKGALQRLPLPRTGSVESQGDQILNAQLYRTLTGYTGAGVAVGVISDGDSGVSTDQGTGDLPATIWNDPNNSTWGSTGAEGTAMMEIIYDLAPGANLGFCGPGTTAEFVQCLNDFTSHFGNTNLVIVDDLGYPGIAMFTDDPDFAVPIQQFQTANPGVRLVTAAGNDADSFWAGTWNPTSINQTINGITYTQAQNFGSTNTQLLFTVQPGDTAQYILEWADTWPPSSSTQNDPYDYDVVLFDASNNQPLACNQGFNISNNQPCNQTNSQPINTPGPQPVQGNVWTNSSSLAKNVYLEILYAPSNVSPGPNPNLKVLIESTNSQIYTTPRTAAGSIYGQSALAYPAEITAGADSAISPDSIEGYSSQGPVFMSQPGVPSFTRMKPDFVGIDCVSVTGAGGFSSPFCGTSAAAPHIAALVALFESGFPNQDPYTLLQAGAKSLGSGSPNGVYGHGLPDAVRSVAPYYGNPAATISAPASNTTVDTGQTVNFAGNCSANGVPGSVSYDWNFGANSGVADSTATSPSVSFKFVGQYTVTLTCTNQFGNTASATLNFTVQAGSSGSSGGGGGLGMITLAALLLMWIAVVLVKPAGWPQH